MSYVTAKVREDIILHLIAVILVLSLARSLKSIHINTFLFCHNDLHLTLFGLISKLLICELLFIVFFIVRDRSCSVGVSKLLVEFFSFLSNILIFELTRKKEDKQGSRGIQK